MPSATKFRVAFFLVAGLIAVLVVTLPFAIQSLIDDLSRSVEGAIYPFVGTSESGRAQNSLHISIVNLDESRLTATLRVSGHRVCPSPCESGSRVILFSLGTEEGATAGMPPSANIDLTNAKSAVTESIDLPIRGHPTLYPFDVYDLWLGVGLAELGADQSVRPLSREEASGLLAITFQELLPREHMVPPRQQDAFSVQEEDEPIQLQGLHLLRFSRPLYEQVLAVLLVLLVAAAAAYAVFMRPLHDLVINSGGLVLGVWGIRSILAAGTASRTLVDLSLSLVILFLLSAITFRAVQFLFQRSNFRPSPEA